MLTSLGKTEVLSYLSKLASPKSDDIESLVLSYLYAKNAYRINPNDLSVLRKLASNLYNLKDYVNALECAEKWFDLASRENNQKASADMLFIKGMSLFYLGKYENVDEILRKAIDRFAQPKDNEKIAQAREVVENLQTNQGLPVYNSNDCIQ